MGSEVSFQPPGEAPQGVAAVSLNESDKLRVIHQSAVPGLTDAVRSAVRAAWPRGVEKEVELGDAVQWKLKGSPWAADGADAVASRRVVAAILRGAAACGAELVASSDVSRCYSDASCLFFAAGAPRAPPPGAAPRVVCVSTNEWDKLRLIDAPEQDQHLLETAILDAVREWWPQGLQEASTYHGVPQYKLKGTPWHAHGEEPVHSRRLVCGLLRGFQQRGYVLHAAVDTSRRLLGRSDTDSLFFRYDPAAREAVHDWCAVAPASWDKLRVIGMPDPPECAEGLNRSDGAVGANWPKGIQRQQMYAGAYELKLHGNPWFANGEDAVHSRRLVGGMLEMMAREGWVLRGTADLSRKDNDKSAFFFSRPAAGFCGAREAPRAAPVLCVSLNDSDKIRVVGGSARGRAAAVAAAKRAVAQGWPKGVQREQDYHGAFELKLKGNPWWSSGCDALYSRSVLCHVARGLLDAGCRPLCSADVSAKHDDNGPIDVNSLFFMEEATEECEPHAMTS